MSSRVQETSVLLVQLFNCFGYIVREAILRPGSHYGENHDDGDGNVYGDGKNAVNRSHTKLSFRHNGVQFVANFLLIVYFRPVQLRDVRV